MIKKAIIIYLLSTIAVVAETDNSAYAYCLEKLGYKQSKFDGFNWQKAAACVSNIKAAEREVEMAELRDFIKHNPRYRVPGQSLNRCWGKPREMPFKNAYIKQTAGGFEAGVSYKDTMPAGCYENGSWDNRKK